MVNLVQLLYMVLLVKTTLRRKKMGGGGGGGKRGPSPAEQAAAQIAAQRRERERQEAERGVRADQFLADNRLTDVFRDAIYAQSDVAAQKQYDLLGQQSGNIFQDIRQRNAARGLSDSSSGSGLQSQAQRLTGSSRDDIFDQARVRAENRISDQQRLLDSSAGDIRAGRNIDSAQNAFRNDLSSANAAFEKALSSAATGDQRNKAFQGFESDRRSAAARFNESVNQFNQAGFDAAVATGGGGTSGDDDFNFGGSLG